MPFRVHCLGADVRCVSFFFFSSPSHSIPTFLKSSCQLGGQNDDRECPAQRLTVENRGPKSRELVRGLPAVMDYARRIHDRYFPDYEGW